jgi:hypothetical protein
MVPAPSTVKLRTTKTTVTRARMPAKVRLFMWADHATAEAPAAPMLGTLSIMDGAPTTETRNPALPPDARGDIESWFVRRGVPQLIADYATERSMDTRGRPFVVIWLIVGSFWWWGTRPDAPLWMNLLGGLLVLATMAIGVAVIRKVRGQVMWWVDRRLDALETFSLGLFVAVPSGLIGGSWSIGISNGLNALLGMGVIYIVVGLGIGEIAWWSLKRLRQELARITGLLARTLPVLLILVLFLLFASELWEAAHLLTTAELMAVVALLALVAATLVLTTFRAELRSFSSTPVDQLASLATSTPAAALVETVDFRDMPELRTLQRLNVSVLVLLGQLIQSAFVALVIAGFLVVFGVLALPASLQESWIGEDVTGLATFDFLSETRVLSQELVTTSILLGSVVGLYFTGLAVTDSGYRTAHFDRLVDEVRHLLSAHAFYVAALHEEPS